MAGVAMPRGEDEKLGYQDGEPVIKRPEGDSPGGVDFADPRRLRRLLGKVLDKGRAVYFVVLEQKKKELAGEEEAPSTDLTEEVEAGVRRIMDIFGSAEILSGRQRLSGDQVSEIGRMVGHINELIVQLGDAVGNFSELLDALARLLRIVDSLFGNGSNLEENLAEARERAVEKKEIEHIQASLRKVA